MVACFNLCIMYCRSHCIPSEVGDCTFSVSVSVSVSIFYLSIVEDYLCRQVFYTVCPVF